MQEMKNAKHKETLYASNNRRFYLGVIGDVHQNDDATILNALS